MPSSSSTLAQSGVRGRGRAPASSCCSATGISRLPGSCTAKALRLTGIEPASASLAWVAGLTYHFRNSMALALFGADFGTPAMKMPICAIAFSCFGTTPKSSLPATFGLLRVVGLQRVAGILDDRAGIAAEDRGALLVGIELDDAGRRVLLHRADEEIGRRLAGVGIEGDVPLVVEELAAEGQEERVPAGDDRIAARRRGTRPDI